MQPQDRQEGRPPAANVSSPSGQAIGPLWAILARRCSSALDSIASGIARALTNDDEPTEFVDIYPEIDISAPDFHPDISPAFRPTPETRINTHTDSNRKSIFQIIDII